jgi:hypothetical protein
MLAAIEAISVVTKLSREVLYGYLSEIETDDSLRKHVSNVIHDKNIPFADINVKYGRRLLFYLWTRALRPKIVVEAGVDKGLGACMICSALQRNADEGSKGYYIGVDIGHDKGLLFSHPYDVCGEIIYGDSVEFLKSTKHNVDLFFHETSSDPHHTRSQLQALECCLSPAAVVSSCWYTQEFLDFAIRTHRKCLTFRESPENHWYPGSIIPIAFK